MKNDGSVKECELGFSNDEDIKCRCFHLIDDLCNLKNWDRFESVG